ncbi:homocysteine S-methyltransferase family protein [Pelagibacteraceae bacterium]|nr:homocysteine S-methyltransferase family protein [Pelagibacteraceae bacterium]
MDKDFFKKIRILDGGMGQELLNRGVKPHGTIWGASALLHKKYHKTVIKTHLDFIKAGAEVIVTNSFGSRRRRLIENNLENKYKNLNKLAGKLAKIAVKKSKKKILIAGSLPPQNFTYFSDLGKDLKFIKDSFKSQAICLNPYVDFFYLDVMSSLKECKIGIKAISSLKKKFIIGIHLRKNGKLPSGENFISVVKKLEKYKPLGILASCVSTEDLSVVIKNIKKIKVPFGFKINAFEHIPAGWKPDSNNPKVQLGKRKDLTPKKFLDVCKKFKKMGAKIIGGCCEIKPSHIKALKKLV